MTLLSNDRVMMLSKWGFFEDLHEGGESNSGIIIFRRRNHVSQSWRSRTWKRKERRGKRRQDEPNEDKNWSERKEEECARTQTAREGECVCDRERVGRRLLHHAYHQIHQQEEVLHHPWHHSCSSFNPAPAGIRRRKEGQKECARKCVWERARVNERGGGRLWHQAYHQIRQQATVLHRPLSLLHSEKEKRLIGSRGRSIRGIRRKVCACKRERIGRRKTFLPSDPPASKGPLASLHSEEVQADWQQEEECVCERKRQTERERRGSLWNNEIFTNHLIHRQEEVHHRHLAWLRPEEQEEADSQQQEEHSGFGGGGAAAGGGRRRGCPDENCADACLLERGSGCWFIL